MVLIVFEVAFHSAGAMTLQTAINLALLQNKELMQTGILLTGSEADLDIANAGFDVQVKPTFTEQRVGGTVLKNYGLALSKNLETGGQISISATRGDTILPNGVLIVQPAFSIALQQPLFRSAGSEVSLNSVHTAESTLVQARRKYAQARADLVLQVVDAYTQAHKLDEQLKLDQLTVEQISELSRITQEYALVGRAKTLDVLRTNFQLDEAQSRLTADQQAYQAAQSELAELLGMQPDASIETQSVAWPDYQDLQLNEAVKVALSNRLDYAQARQDYDDAVRELDVAQNQLLPGIDLTLGYQRYSASPVPGGSVSAGGGPTIGISSDIGVNYSVQKATVRKAEAQLDAMRIHVELVREEVTRDVERDIYAYQQARTADSITERAAADARARSQLARELFRMGRADSFAVTDAAAAVIAAQSASLNADVEVVQAGYKLSATLGTLLPPSDSLMTKSGLQ